MASGLPQHGHQEKRATPPSARRMLSATGADTRVALDVVSVTSEDDGPSQHDRVAIRGIGNRTVISGTSAGHVVRRRNAPGGRPRSIADPRSTRAWQSRARIPTIESKTGCAIRLRLADAPAGCRRWPSAVPALAVRSRLRASSSLNSRTFSIGDHGLVGEGLEERDLLARRTARRPPGRRPSPRWARPSRSMGTARMLWAVESPASTRDRTPASCVWSMI